MRRESRGLFFLDVEYLAVPGVNLNFLDLLVRRHDLKGIHETFMFDLQFGGDDASGDRGEGGIDSLLE